MKFLKQLVALVFQDLSGLYNLMQNIPEIYNLVKIISKLPGLGPKSTKRIILKLMNNRQELMKPLTQTLSEVYKNVARCKNCGSLKSNNSDCDNCQNNSKKYTKIFSNNKNLEKELISFIN